VKIAAVPLGVCEGVIVPHGVFAQLTCQSTPEFVASFFTTAITVAVAFVSIVGGGGCVMVTTGGAVTWNVVAALQKGGSAPGTVGTRLEQVWSAVAYAVILTVLPTMVEDPVTGEGITKLNVPPDAE
jgi:hypothetical protein